MFFEDDTGNADCRQSRDAVTLVAVNWKLLSESSLPPFFCSQRLRINDHQTYRMYYCQTVALLRRCANQRSGEKCYRPHPTPINNALLHGDQTELPAVRKWNGKGRAVDENQSSPSAATARRKATTHAFDQPLSFTSLINSSKARAREKAIEHPPPFTLTGEPGPSRTIVNASKGTARDNRIRQPHFSPSSLSILPAVARQACF
ncbi:hypothetical protein DFH29DRAFT_1008532 [Suillus ampliporus]|nr:hypothetical protein DFH29DRAFT_1008532 [Suillus ampliporus]